VFLGSGLLFLAPLFAATAVAGGLVESYATAAPDPDVWTFGRAREMTTSAPGRMPCRRPHVRVFIH